MGKDSIIEDEKKLLKNIADWVVNYGCARSLSGNYYISFSDVAKQLSVTEDFIIQHRDDISNEMDFDKICECEFELDETGGPNEFCLWFWNQAICNCCGDKETHDYCSCCDISM